MSDTIDTTNDTTNDTNDSDTTNDNGMSTLDAITAALMGLGHNVEPRESLPYGRLVASTLKTIDNGGFVAVVCEGTSDAYVKSVREMIAENPNLVALVDATAHSFARVRANVGPIVKRTKSGKITPPRRELDEIGDSFPAGFLVRKSA